MQASACSWWNCPGVATTTASTPSSAIAAGGSPITRQPGTPTATCSAFSAKASLTAVTRAPEIRLCRRATWSAPIIPTPSTATRSSLAGTSAVTGRTPARVSAVVMPAAPG